MLVKCKVNNKPIMVSFIVGLDKCYFYYSYSMQKLGWEYYNFLDYIVEKYG